MTNNAVPVPNPPPAAARLRAMPATSRVTGAALGSIGIPKDSVLKYEIALKTDRYLLLVNGTDHEAGRAREILQTTHPAELNVHSIKPAEVHAVAKV